MNAWRRLLVGTAFEREQELLGGFEAPCGVPGDHLEQDVFKPAVDVRTVARRGKRLTESTTWVVTRGKIEQRGGPSRRTGVGRKSLLSDEPASEKAWSFPVSTATRMMAGILDLFENEDSRGILAQ
jgi:hypothetical protein